MTKALNDAGKADDTLILFTADNGGQTKKWVVWIWGTLIRNIAAGETTFLCGGTRLPCGKEAQELQLLFTGRWWPGQGEAPGN